MKRIQHTNVNVIDINKSYVEIDGVGWRIPQHISIKEIMDFMQLDIPRESNVKLVTFADQDVSVNRPPDTYLLEKPLNLAVDENFLYVWINKRWKRVPLSEF